MALCKTLIRLASRRQLDKADVEAVYGELVRVIGGTRFVNGSPVGPAAGILDWRNFSPEAGITNDLKAAPLSWYVVSYGFTDTGGTGTDFIPAASTFRQSFPIPLLQAGIVNPSPSTTAFSAFTTTGSFTATCTFVSSATNSGSITLNRIRAGVTTQLGTTVNYTNVATSQPLIANQTGISTDIRPGDIIQLVWTSTTAAITGPSVTMWFKALHCRG